MSDGRRHWRRRRRRARDLRPSSSCQKVRAMRRREREGRRAGRSIRREHGPLKTVITTDVEKSQPAHHVTVFLYMCLHVGRMWCTERTSSYNRKVSLTFNKGRRFKVLQSHSNVVLVLFTQIFKTVWIFPRRFLSSLLSRYVELDCYMLPDTAVGLPSAETETDDDSETRGKEKTARTS